MGNLVGIENFSQINALRSVNKIKELRLLYGVTTLDLVVAQFMSVLYGIVYGISLAKNKYKAFKIFKIKIFMQILSNRKKSKHTYFFKN